MSETTYAALGGAEGCRALAEAFYGRVDDVPVLRPFFPGKSHRCAIEAFASFLVQFLGGPAEESQDRWFLSLRESHARFKIGEEHRVAWLSTMNDALDEVVADEATRTTLWQFFESTSTYLANPESDQPRTVQHGIDDLVAAIHWVTRKQRRWRKASFATTTQPLRSLGVAGDDDPQWLLTVCAREGHRRSLTDP